MTPIHEQEPVMPKPRVLHALQRRFFLEFTRSVIRVILGAPLKEESDRMLQWVLDNAG